MGLREGVGQGPGPPAPAAANRRCGAPEPPLLGHLSRSAGGEGGGRISRCPEGRPGLPLGPKLPAPSKPGPASLQNAAHPSVPPREAQSGDSPRSVFTRAAALRPPKSLSVKGTGQGLGRDV